MTNPQQGPSASDTPPSRTGRRLADPPAPSNRLEEREVVHGAKPGDVAVRVRRLRGFRRRPQDVLEVQDEALEPHQGLPRLLNNMRVLLFGRPLATHLEVHERLTKTKGLAVLSSDALSSVAYATEETLLALSVIGAGLFTLTLPIAISIVLLLVIVTVSYRQTIEAYPHGGGSFIVARDNLGVIPGLIAAASLLIDYVLTVAVSTGAGVAAVISAFPEVAPFRVPLGLLFMTLITLGNMRGIRESGALFSAPAYLFIGGMFTLIAWGLGGLAMGTVIPNEIHEQVPAVAAPLLAFVVLRAFASGSSALTGVEAISDGTPAFQPPEAKNAKATLTTMALLLGAMFLGISYLAVHLGIRPNEHVTVVSQITELVAGRGLFYYYVQFATAMILVLAANTAFSDFPRVASIMAREGFMPRQFSFRGDRLAFNTGIIVLAGLAAMLFTVFGGSVNGLIPLYAVGVFLSFTLSQAGMVMRWWKQRPPGWRKRAVVNGIGAFTTAVVALIHATTKFMDGAWMVIILIPILMLLFKGINAHYNSVKRQLKPQLDDPFLERKETRVIMPVSELSQATLRAFTYARAISDHITVVHVTDNKEAAQTFRHEWERQTGVPLVVVESPYRSLEGPFLALVDAVLE
ncbi:MAG: APC family permease, partial [Chloroflexi bacterium]|nr:APC family permease [Chloroflexota bacterium]